MATIMSPPTSSTTSSRQVIEVPHVEQCYTWDCGLACLSMALKYLGIPASEIYTKDLDAQQCGESVWTIDLAYIAARYAIPHRLCTITLGAHPDHATKSFYSKFSKDEKRVNELFHDALAHGTHVEECSVKIEDITDHIHSGNVVIVLLDWRYLECIWCRHDVTRCCLCCLELAGHSGYQGHFVVACGYDKTNRYIFYKNPNKTESLCCCRFEAFDKARKASGTDEDILFLYKKERQPLSLSS